MYIVDLLVDVMFNKACVECVKCVISGHNYVSFFQGMSWWYFNLGH